MTVFSINSGAFIAVFTFMTPVQAAEMGILEPQAATVAKSSRKQNFDGRTNERTNQRTNGRRDERTDGRKKRQTNGRTDERRHYELHGTIQSRNPVSGNVRLQNEQPKASLNSVQDERIDGRTNERVDGRTNGRTK
ncbi:hypothetical protein DPMN_038538 [Dreissena polymorpha]|uniref:Secreted protein n=1 Tax=Dreissena polymorpha TaxID=45954 RepID=A0A9D4MFL7_DREPO|nr:hypothetical protein DPMN_038538 [Dreissena polymorpha]